MSKKAAATNITWHEGTVTRTDRQSLLKQKGVTIWFTGLSGSGKSTLAVSLEETLLLRQHHPTYRLDGDNIRMGLCSDLGFSKDDRTENIRRIGEVCTLFADSGMIILASFVSPYRADRDAVRKLHEERGLEFVECFVDCPLEEAERRDPKGLYEKARKGEIRGFTGVDDPYEEPEGAELRVRTDLVSLEDGVKLVIDYLKKRGFLEA